MKIVTVEQMQKAEQDCAIFGISVETLMENAGKAVAVETRRILGHIPGKSILVLVGPGNNGGDGLVAARHLQDDSAVTVYLCGPRSENDANLEKVVKKGIPCLRASDDQNLNQLDGLLCAGPTVLDSIFGTGKSRALKGVYSGILNKLNEFKKTHPGMLVISVDLPSGLDADTGAIDPATPFCDHTVTLGFPKSGLFNLPGAERAGNITVVDIGIPAHLTDYVNPDFMTDTDIRNSLPLRPTVSHKGTFGKVLALTGSINYPGAAYLACTAATRVGAGLTTLAIAESLLPVLAAKLTEVTYLPLPDQRPGVPAMSSASLIRQQMPQYNVFLAGCGTGQGEPAAQLLKSLLLDPNFELPSTVLDADALNILARLPEWWKNFAQNAILTPHSGEMSRLLDKPIQEIQAHRADMASQAAVTWKKTVVLKGAYTVIASPDGRVAVSPFANPVLASAGTGDVLAGAIAGLRAQGLSPFDAAACGVYLHGKAAELLRTEIGDAGTVASDLLRALPRAIRQLKDN
jgi:ADP-dependent NAD(P)H-hydrate dehydratase / NAD(P)H-hydrate epimerase